MIPPVLFDMDGVLLVGPTTHPGVYRAATHDALSDVGIDDPSPSTADVLEALRYDPAMADACDSLGIDIDAWWAARERHASRRANARVRSGDRAVFSDAGAVLAGLRSEHRLGLVSNNREATVRFVADYCFPDTFDVVVGRHPTIDDYERRKPDPTFINRALDQLGCTRDGDPGDGDGSAGDAAGIYVGDRGSDVVAARRAGLEPILIERPYTTLDPADVDATPAAWIDSLASLPSAVAEISQ
ncbi:HAD family hydrolase [Halorubrum vacuolatum]|uniref:Phosphoglycolate phosphatase, HAD superfamily n=1 Tax=Halorubrum vacuolatum TaxID=63740 RepID=A0A238VY76_HALVU|nr:HAD hydrolase-like protein [Halorubrum vacuolatum]SNR39246.1 Phosphoglycolate phosphatase, HAD superfamily [Halorubrum vacuolatum]